MTENLDVDHYRNGDLIPEAKTDAEWRKADTAKMGCWRIYDNDAAMGKKFGKLYNWYAVNDRRGLSPEGWHVPTDAEWNILVHYLGGPDVAGGRLQKRKTTRYLPFAGCLPEVDTTWTEDPNKSGFTALLGGYVYLGYFHGWEEQGMWWSATTSFGDAWYRQLYSDDTNIYRHAGGKGFGFSVRCVKDK